MPIIRKSITGALEEQRVGREIGQLRAGTTRPNPNGGRPIPMSLETIRFTTTKEESAEALAAKYDSTPVRVELANGQKTIEVVTTTKTIEAIIPPGGAAISQWREMWTGGWCQRRCDAVTEQKTQSPCMCPEDPAERKALADQGEACKDRTRVNLILPDIPGLGVWRIATASYFAGIEMGMTVEFLADLSAKGLPLPVVTGIDSRIGVLAPKTRGGKPQSTKFPVWIIDPKHTASEIVVLANSEYGMAQALSSTPVLALGTSTATAAITATSTAQAPIVQPDLDPNEALATEVHKKAIRKMLGDLPADQKMEFDRWIDNEKRAGGIHSMAQLTIGDAATVMAKLDSMNEVVEPEMVWEDDDENGRPF